MKEGFHQKKRAKKMLPEIATLISRMAASDEDREALAARIISKIKADYPNEIPPTPETVLQRISRARNQDSKPVDGLWHMGTVSEPEYRISAEAIPYILKVQKESQSRGRPGITIRQAKWIDRLFAVKEIQDTESLSYVSFAYALHELSWDNAKLPPPCDTSRLDKSLIDGTWKTALSKLADDKVDFKSFKRAFEETTKLELRGLMVPATAIVVVGDVLFAMVKGADGEEQPMQMVRPEAGADSFIKDLKRRRMISRIVTQHHAELGSVPVIFLKRPLLIQISSSKILEAQNEREHSQKKG
jgi:hypothetical protein